MKFSVTTRRHLTMVDYHGLIMVDMSNGIIINGIMDHQYFYPLVIKQDLLENPSFGSMISHETTTRNLHLVRGFHTTQPPQISHVIPEAPCHAPDFPSGGESGLIPTPVWVGLILEENPSHVSSSLFPKFPLKLPIFVVRGSSPWTNSNYVFISFHMLSYMYICVPEVIITWIT